MKKLFIVAAVAAIALTSCQEEKDFKGATGETNEVAFVLQGGAATRAADASVAMPERKGISQEIAQIGEHQLYLEESIVNLNGAQGATRGTPLYTENLGYLYRDKLSVHTAGFNGTQDAVFSQNDDAMYQNEWWRYSYTFPVNIWENKESPVEFYLRMPSDMGSHGISNLSYYGGATSFDYTTPATAVAQEDIVFSFRKMNFNQYYAEYTTKGGAEFILYHALTGIKFAIANDAAELAKLKITKITFTGLKNAGSGSVGFSSNGAATVTWNASAATDNQIYQEFTAYDLVTYNKDTDANHFADSYFDGGIKQNLNDAQATKTFWLIPQSITDSDATIRIDFTLNDNADYMEIRLGDLHASNWEAGDLRTYTFKVNEVNLKIEDEVELNGDANNGYEGSVKSGVTITNTGNTRAFIRASLVGQWLRDIYAIDPDTGEETSQLIESYPVFGFTDNVNNLYEVASWYQDQFVKLDGASAPARDQGHFVELAGYDKDNGYNDWVLCSDGYYYYTVAVEPESQDVNGNSKTKDLFKEYIVGTAPMSTIAGLAINNKNMHFALEIATQAVAANTLNGTVDTWQNAWQKAGVTPTPVQ